MNLDLILLKGAKTRITNGGSRQATEGRRLYFFATTESVVSANFKHESTANDYAMTVPALRAVPELLAISVTTGDGFTIEY